MDISKLSLPELRQLQDDIAKQLKQAEQANLAAARDQILAIAKDHGLSLQDLIGTGAARLKKSSVAVRYRHPENASQQWTGRGRQPRWVKEWAESGKSLDLLKI
jgi:DNA-binding protein H-NS